MRRYLLLLLIFGVQLVCTPSHATTMVGFEAGSLNYQLQYLRIKSTEALPGDLAAAPWQSMEGTSNSFGFSDDRFMFRLQLTNTTPAEQPLLIEIAYPLIDSMKVYHDQLSDQDYITTFGDELPFHQRPVDHRYFVLPWKLSPGGNTTLYFDIQTTSAIQLPLTIWEPIAFHQHDAKLRLWFGAYFGIMAAMALYNLFLFAAVRNQAYLWYMGYVVTFALLQATIEGYAFQYLWPNSIHWNSICMAFLIGVMSLTVYSFQILFLDLKNQAPYFYRFAQISIGISLLMIVATFILPYRLVVSISMGLTLLSCLVALIVGYWVWYKGYAQAKYYCLAWTVLIVAGLFTWLNMAGVLPREGINEYSTQVGSLLEVILLSFALADSINKERRMRYQAQRQALEFQLQHNELLEEKVRQRTMELENANKKLKALSQTDQLTGIYNRRYLDTKLNEELVRCHRYQHPMAVLLMDIDHFKQFNDQHGHLAGDACLQLIASSISEALRWPNDVVTRYGGEEFCVILPETDSGGALKVAERIRKTICEASFIWQGKQLPVTVSIGVKSVSQGMREEAIEVLKCADDALYKAKQNGRNRVEQCEQDQNQYDQPNLTTTFASPKQ